MSRRVPSIVVGSCAVIRTYLDVVRRPGAGRPVAGALIASLPIGMLGLAVLLLVQQARSSYAEAGLVLGLLGAGTAVGMLVQGRLIDRWGQARVLLPAAAVQSFALVGLVVLVDVDDRLWPLGLLAAVAGAAEPQVGASLRALWAALVPTNSRHTATALSSILFELPVLLGPLVLAALLLVTTPTVAVLASGACFTVGSWVLSRSEVSRSWRAGPRRRGTMLGALASPAVRTACAIAGAHGLLVGLLQVPAAAFAVEQGAAGQAGLLYSAMSAGSLAGIAVYGVRRMGLRPDRWLVTLLLALTIAVSAGAAAPSLPIMGVTMFFAGVCLGPIAVTCFGLVDRFAIPGTVVDAFATITALSVASFAGGTACAGLLIDYASTSAAFLAGAGITAASAALVVMRRRTLMD